MRKIIFTNGQYYHIYNRGVDKRKIFLRNGHYKRFIETVHNLLTLGTSQSNLITHQSLAFSEKLSFICYCLMPNHYHFLIKQLAEHAISDFMHNLNTSYTKYFNINNKRTGRLFEYTFKAVHVETEEQLLQLSRYIHLNPLTSGLVLDLRSYSWSSYLDYIGLRNGKLCQKEDILSFFGKDFYVGYEKFVQDQADYLKSLGKIEKMLVE